MLQTIRPLLIRPGCFRLERELPGGICTHGTGAPSQGTHTKKKELVGNYSNKGTDDRPAGEPRRTEVHDFENKELGKVVPYGIYDLADNSGWVSVGVTSDTAEFAVNAIRCWFDKMGRARYPAATRLMITADCGGSNSLPPT